MEHKEAHMMNTMFVIKFIDNIVYNGEGVCAVGRMGYPTKVFLRQEVLDGACGVYSLLMLLMFHKMITREDLTEETCRSDPPYIKRLKKQFLNPLKGINSNGSTLIFLRDKLLRVLDNQMPVNVYMASHISKDGIDTMILRSKIKEQLDAGLPVLFRYSRPETDIGHAVVAIGYTICEEVLRLYCLDPSCPIAWYSIWNNVIDVKLKNDNEVWPDYNHRSDSKVDVNGILLIEENNDLDSRLPF